MDTVCIGCGLDREIASKGLCVSCASKSWRRRNPQRVKDTRQAAYQREKQDQDASWATWARRAAKGRGVSAGYLASLQDATERCPVCGVLLAYAADDTTDAHATLDRIIPGVDYSIRANLIILCLSCNRRKNDGDLEFFRRLVSWLERVEPAARAAVDAASEPETEPESIDAPIITPTQRALDHLAWVESLR